MTSTEDIIDNYYFGDLNDFISSSNMNDVYKTIAAEFPEIANLSSIG